MIATTKILLILFSFTGSLVNSIIAEPTSFSPCGDARAVSRKVGSCLDKIFELSEGKVPKPRNDADLLQICERFSLSEKCIRSTSKECLSGIHRTTTSSVAASSRRFRSHECKSEQTRSKYFEAMDCCNKVSQQVISIYQNHTAIVQAIRDSPSLRPEVKLAKVCCIFNELDRELALVYDSKCPNSKVTILKILHSLTEDARSTVCLNPKCQNALTGFTKAKYKPSQQIIEPIMEVLFSLAVNGDQ